MASLDDDELAPIVQQKLQEIHAWLDRTQQWYLHPAPTSSVPSAFAQPPMPHEYSQPQPQVPYPAKTQERPKQNPFANTDPSKIVEFKPMGLQLPTPTSPQSRESFAGVPNEEPAASTIESAQDNIALETSVDWTNPSNGGGWANPESNPDTIFWGEQLEEDTEGNGLTARFDWAEDTERTFPIPQPSEDINTAWPAPEASMQEPAAEITKDMVDDWVADNALVGGSWSVEDNASGWDDPPKVAESAGDIGWGFTPSNATRDTNGANEDDWNTIPSKQKKSKPVAKKSPPLTPKPKDRDIWPRKGPVEKDRKAWGRGGKEEEFGWSTGARNNAKKGKKGDKPPPAPATKPFANTNTKVRPAKEKRQDQATGPKDAFTFNRVTSSSSSVATLQDTRKDQDEDPDLDSLPELPPELKAKNYPPEFEITLRQAVVPKVKIPDRPSVAPLPENTNIDKGMNWVNGKLKTVRNTDTPKGFSERKVQMDDTNGWHPALVKRSNGKASPPNEDKIERWPKLGQ